MEILDGVLSKYDKTENYNMDEIHTPWGKIQTVHGWPSNYAKYKLGFDEMAIQYYKRSKFLICPFFNIKYLVLILSNKVRGCLNIAMLSSRRKLQLQLNGDSLIKFCQPGIVPEYICWLPYLRYKGNRGLKHCQKHVQAVLRTYLIFEVVFIFDNIKSK